jgi:hypothetical protein
MEIHQEELWRAYQMLRQIAQEAGRSELGLKAAALGMRCLNGISPQFGRAEEIRRGSLGLWTWLHGHGPLDPLIF